MSDDYEILKQQNDAMRVQLARLAKIELEARRFVAQFDGASGPVKLTASNPMLRILREALEASQ